SIEVDTVEPGAGRLWLNPDACIDALSFPLIGAWTGHLEPRQRRPEVASESLLASRAAFLFLAPVAPGHKQIVDRRLADLDLAARALEAPAQKEGQGRCQILEVAPRLAGAFRLHEIAARGEPALADKRPVEDAGALAEQPVDESLVLLAVPAAGQHQHDKARG